MTATQAAGTRANREEDRTHVAHLEYASRKAPILGPNSGIHTREQADEMIDLILRRNGYASGH